MTDGSHDDFIAPSEDDGFGAFATSVGRPAPDRFERLDQRAKGPRRPRIALMGEFSAGKSTLTNMLIGERALPTQVTATQLPPVWITHGAGEPYLVDREGNARPVKLTEFSRISVEDTAYIRIYAGADILMHCDLIDMPGISDPNMDPEVWESVIEHADGVLWCTHATQAWRQSEAAVWGELPETLYDRSLLLITRIDKIVSVDDRRRLIARVDRETRGLFAGRYPISLLEALGAGDDAAAWDRSGAQAFSDALADLVGTLQADLGAADGTATAPMRRPSRLRPAAAPAEPLRLTEADEVQDDGSRILPSRIRPIAARPRTRPAAD